MRKLGIVLVFLAACGNGGGGDGDDDGDPIDAPVSSIDAPIPEGYTRLVGRGWTLPPGASDTYRCARITIPSDMYITSIMAQAPLGTHHTVLSIAGANGTSGPDGEQNCSVGTLGTVMLYASGVGTSPLDFPTDVGIRVAAGTQVHLNLHLYNTSDTDLTGESAILVKSQPTPPPILAEMVFAGSYNVVVQPNSTGVAQGGCTVNANSTLFALWPHMHQVATRQTITLRRGASGPIETLLDEPYSFTEQRYWLQDPEIQVNAGDRLDVRCEYNNTTNRLITFGDSSDQEMCFGGLYRYPAQGGNLFSCVDG
jgi:hypothetical protein